MDAFSINDFTAPDYSCFRTGVSSCGAFEVASLVMSCVMVFGGWLFFGVDKNDLVPPYVDVDEQEKDGAFVVSRARVEREPLSVLRPLVARLEGEGSFSVGFDGEDGIDLGGLSREFFCIFMRALQRGNADGLFGYSESELAEYGFTRRSFYRALFGEVFSFIHELEDLEVEEFVDPNVIQRIFALSEESWRNEVSMYSEWAGLSRSFKLEMFSLWISQMEETEMKSFYQQCLDFVCGRGIAEEEMRELIESVEGEECIGALSEKVFSYLEAKFGEQSLNAFDFMRELVCADDGTFDSVLYVELQERAEAGNIFPGVQGTFNAQAVVDAMVLTDAAEGEERRLLQEKIDRLKRAMLGLATPDEVKLFTRFVTGNTLLVPGQQIIVGACRERWKYISANTCNKLFDLYVPTQEGVDDTDERLFFAVLSPMRHMAFSKS